MKKLRVYDGRECRVCKGWFTKVGGYKHHEHMCCSETCFIRLGPPHKATPVKINPNKAYTTWYDPDSSRRKTRKERFQKKISKRRHTTSYGSFYTCDAWLALRYAVIEKYGRVCMACGTDKGSMHVDHIIPRSHRRDLELTFNNLQILCKSCNLGKSNRYSTDFREGNPGSESKKQDT